MQSQMLVWYDALQKRMVFLGAFAEGLETFKIHTAMKHFTPLFEQMFLPPTYCSPCDVLAILTIPKNFNGKQNLVTSFLKDSIQQLNEEGEMWSHN